jgi:hypothetical protein
LLMVEFPFIDIKSDHVSGAPLSRIFMNWEISNELVKSYHESFM